MSFFYYESIHIYGSKSIYYENTFSNGINTIFLSIIS